MWTEADYTADMLCCSKCGAPEIRKRTQEEFDTLPARDKEGKTPLDVPYFQVRAYKVYDEQGAWSHCTVCDEWFL